MRIRPLALAALGLPLLWGAVSLGAKLAAIFDHRVAPIAAGEFAIPPPATGRPVVAILVSNQATELTDLVAPYVILSASGALDVVTVAPERRVSALTGGAALLPHASFESFAEIYASADWVVIPAVMNADDPVMIGWLREQRAGPRAGRGSQSGSDTVAAEPRRSFRRGSGFRGNRMGLDAVACGLRRAVRGYRHAAAARFRFAGGRRLARRRVAHVGRPHRDACPGGTTVRSRFGLDFSASHDFESASRFDRLIESEPNWRPESGDRSPFDSVLTELALRYGRAPARTAAAQLELPRVPLDRRWHSQHGPDRAPLELLLVPFGLAGCGAALAVAASAWRRRYVGLVPSLRRPGAVATSAWCRRYKLMAQPSARGSLPPQSAPEESRRMI